MEKQNREQTIIEILTISPVAISATALAKHFGVSRQSVVGDIALLRAKGIPIIATSKGYILKHNNYKFSQVIASEHTEEETELELQLIIKHGVEVIDVWVEHAVYENLKGDLNIKTQDDIDQFLNKKTPLLLSLTQGKHFHTLGSNSQDAIDDAIKDLEANGFTQKVS